MMLKSEKFGMKVESETGETEIFFYKVPVTGILFVNEKQTIQG